MAANMYTVKRGDTLSGIASRLGKSNWRSLYKGNKKVIGRNPNLILPGQKLSIPGSWGGSATVSKPSRSKPKAKASVVSGGKANTRKVALPGLSANDFADIASRRRAATSNFQLAQTNAQREQARSGARWGLEQSQIVRGAEGQSTQLMQGLADMGSARNPRTAGRGNTAISDATNRTIALGEADLGERIQSLQMVVQEARRNRDRTLADLSAEEVRRKTDYDRMMGN